MSDKEGNPFYKTNIGTVTGSIHAIPAALNWINIGRTYKILGEELKNATENDQKFQILFNTKGIKGSFKENIEILKKDANRLAKYAVPYAIIASALTARCGILVDNVRNNKAKEVANKTQYLGKANMMMEKENVLLSNRGNTYYQSNIGSKYGALLGADCGSVSTLMGVKTKLTLLTIPIFALAGWIVGKLTDHNMNKEAKKYA